MSELLSEQRLFFDPFAEGGEELFDPLQGHQTMWQRYAAGEVRHDYTADKFVADTEALMMDARFVGQFEAAKAIAEQMHMLCGEDHGLRESMEASSFFHDHHTDHEHNQIKAQKETEKERSKKSRKAKKKKFWTWFRFKRD